MALTLDVVPFITRPAARMAAELPAARDGLRQVVPYSRRRVATRLQLGA